MIRTLIPALFLATVASLSAAIAAAAPIGTTTVLVQAGDDAPVGPGNFTGFESPPALNNAGQVAFRAFLGGAGVDATNNEGLYRFGDAGTVQIAREGDAPPAGSGTFLIGFGYPALNDAGQVAYLAALAGVGDQRLYRFGDAGTVQIARTGDAVPAGPGTFTAFDASTTVVLNDAGQVAYRARVGGAGVDSTNDRGFYRFSDAGTVQIAREGDAAPAGADTILLGFDTSLLLNDAGQAAYWASLGGAGVTSANNLGLYRFGDAIAVQIAREGDAAPVGPGSFNAFFNPTLNNAGQAAFGAYLRGTGVTTAYNEGLYRFGDAGTIQIARAGDAAPGGPGNFAGFNSPALNDAGQVAFYGWLDGAGIDATNSSGIYLYDDILGLLTVARKGDAFLGSTITGLSFNNSLAEENNGFNNLGQVAYLFTLANGSSGIALFTIPEPAAAALLALGGLTLLLHRSPRVV